MPGSKSATSALQKQIWAGAIPLEITLSSTDCRAYDQIDPYLAHVPRLSYLPFLLPRLHDFFKNALIDSTLPSQEAWLSFDGLPLKWHYPVGLLYDLFAGVDPSQPVSGLEVSGHLPWRLRLHYSEFPDEQLFQLDADGKVILDAYINNVKEADYIRNGSARTVMSLSKQDSDNLWHAVSTHDLSLFETVNTKLQNPVGLTLRHVPIKVYLPTPTGADIDGQKPASVRVVQGLIPLKSDAAALQMPTTLGEALNRLLPGVFPNQQRAAVMARPILHGAVVPLDAVLEDLGLGASYADGFLHVVVGVVH